MSKQELYITEKFCGKIKKNYNTITIDSVHAKEETTLKEKFPLVSCDYFLAGFTALKNIFIKPFNQTSKTNQTTIKMFQNINS